MATIIERYESLEKKLEIKLNDIDKELISAPQDLQACAELAADANDEEHTAKLALDVVSAEVAARLRESVEGRKPRSESQIASEVPLAPEVQKARDEYNGTRHQAEVCRSLVESMRVKASLIRNVCDMTIAGYITPTSYRPERVRLMRGKEA